MAGLVAYIDSSTSINVSKPGSDGDPDRSDAQTKELHNEHGCQEHAYGPDHVLLHPHRDSVGQNCSTQIPDRLKSLGGKKPLIVTDQGIVAVGILKQITDILDAAGMQYAVYDKDRAQPHG